MMVHYFCARYTCFPFLVLKLLRMFTHAFNAEDRNVGAVKKPLLPSHLLVTHGPLWLRLQHLFPDTERDAGFCMIMTEIERKGKILFEHHSYYQRSTKSALRLLELPHLLLLPNLQTQTSTLNKAVLLKSVS